MAYTLQAYIAQAGNLASALPLGLRVVALPGGLEMVPLDSTARKLLDVPLLPLTDEGFAELPETISSTGKRLSGQYKLVYIEAEFFGGVGGQASACFENGKTSGTVSTQWDSINAALRWLGVLVREHEDEFEASGLGAHRDTDAW